MATSSKRVPVKGDPEVAELLRATNTMARHLGSTDRQLREAQGDIDSFVGAMTEGVMRLDAAGRITLANRAFSKMIGREIELGDKTTLDIFRNPELEASIKSVLAGDSPRIMEIVPGPGRLAEAHIAGIPNLAGVRGFSSHRLP
jgi:PAS domain-containing protein